jgi:hypothetical protein
MLERYFAGRTDTSLKNRYNVLVRREAKEANKARKLAAKAVKETETPTQEPKYIELFSVEESALFWSPLFDW